MKAIALSAGHDLSDPGAIYKDLREADLTRKIVGYATDYIRAHGVGVINVPDNLNLVQTIKYINDRANQLDSCVEVHMNKGGGKGVEAWNYQGGPNESDKLSQFLVDACVAETGLQNRGIKDETTNLHGRLGFVHDTTPIAALVETAFLDGDYDFLKSEDNIKKIAKGVARGILSYHGVTWNPNLINPPAPPAQPTPVPTPPTGSQVTRAEFDELKKQVENILFILKKFKEVL